MSLSSMESGEAGLAAPAGGFHVWHIYLRLPTLGGLGVQCGPETSYSTM